MHDFDFNGAARSVARGARIARGVITLTVATLVAACASVDPATRTVYESPGEVADQPAITPITITQLAENPGTYTGRVVTVAGEVGRVLGPRWFTIGGQEFGGEEVLVLGRETSAPLVRSVADTTVWNDIVMVTGVVRLFEEDALEREIGTIDLDGDILDPFDAEPVIVMTEMRVTPRIDVTRPVAVPISIPVPVLREVEIFVPNRATLVGRGAALYNVRVDSVISDRIFWVGPSAEQRLLVIVNDSGPARAAAQPSDTAAQQADSTKQKADTAAKKAAAPTLKKGDMVFVGGLIRPVPEQLDSLRTSLGIGEEHDDAIGSEQVYLDAHRVERISQTPARQGSTRRRR